MEDIDNHIRYFLSHINSTQPNQYFKVVRHLQNGHGYILKCSTSDFCNPSDEVIAVWNLGGMVISHEAAAEQHHPICLTALEWRNQIWAGIPIGDGETIFCYGPVTNEQHQEICDGTS